MVKTHAKYIVIHYLPTEICEAHQTRKSNKSIASTARKKVQELNKPEPRAKWSEPKIDTIKAYQLFFLLFEHEIETQKVLHIPVNNF